MVGDCFVWLVVGVRFGEFGLVVYQPFLLSASEDTVMRVMLAFQLRINLLLQLSRQVVGIWELRQIASFSNVPGDSVVVNDVNHVVSVNSPERGQPITHDGEKGDQHVVDDVDEV
jgi:hypothetical protein